jgi:ribosome-associated protein
MSEASAKKDVQKLQRVIVDALEDVKAQDIQVFNTEHLSPLFERVIIASGTSNRQTKALSASVRDKVRDGGFGKPRIEGEDNGEWIIADCGAAVVHIMQPVIRQYYNLEEIWGDKPVRLKFGAPKPEARAPKAQAKSNNKAGGKAGAEKASAKTLTPKQATAAAKRASAQAAGAAGSGANKLALKVPAKKASAKSVSQSPAKTAKTSAKTPAKKAVKTVAKKVVVGKPVSKPATKNAVSKAAAPRKPAKTTSRKG